MKGVTTTIIDYILVQGEGEYMNGVTTTIIDYILVQGEGEYMNGVTTTIIDRNGSGNMRLPVQGGLTTKF